MTLTTEIQKTLTDTVIEAMRSSNGKLPWRKEWDGSWLPRNGHTGRPYMGVNVFYLQCVAWLNNFESNDWFTFKGATMSNGKVRRGEKASGKVIYWHTGDKDFVDDKDKLRLTKQKPMWLKYFNVWNKDQIDWECPEEFRCVAPEIKETAPWYEPCREALDRMRTTGVRIGRGAPAYIVIFDKVTMPLEKAFIGTNAYWATMFHELGHATGHKKRLHRFENGYEVDKGSIYAYEELVAELCSAYLCQMLRIYDDEYSIDNSARYLNHWISAMNGDSKYIFKASRDAQEAVRYILNYPESMDHRQRVKKGEEDHEKKTSNSER